MSALDRSFNTAARLRSMYSRSVKQTLTQFVRLESSAAMTQTEESAPPEGEANAQGNSVIATANTLREEERGIGGRAFSCACTLSWATGEPHRRAIGFKGKALPRPTAPRRSLCRTTPILLPTSAHLQQDEGEDSCKPVARWLGSCELLTRFRHNGVKPPLSHARFLDPRLRHVGALRQIVAAQSCFERSTQPHIPNPNGVAT